MENCDILIIGAGPAGTSLAWGLRGHGFDVVIMDKAVFPRNKVCAGWITNAVLNTLGIDINDYRHGRTIQPIHGFKVSRIGGDEIETTYSNDPVSYGIRRCEFDHYLLQRCEAGLRLGEAFRDMRRDGRFWIVNDSIRTPLVIGAGGHFCPVARFMGARIGSKESAVAAQEIEFEMTPEQRTDCRVSAEVPELFFCDDMQGYGWVFRKGNYLNIGLGRVDRHRLSEHVIAFCRYLQQRAKLPPDLSEGFNGHAYLMYNHSSRRIIGDGLLLIGDAAGLAYPQSGEGIRPAAESGLLAAAVIKTSRGDYGIDLLGEYQDRIIQRFGNRASASGFKDLLPARWQQQLAGYLMSTRWFIQNTVIDQWFLRTRQLPLLSD